MISLPQSPDGFSWRALKFLGKELRHILPPTIFFAVGFNLVVFSMNLILTNYFIQLGNFLLVTAAALVVGKAVLVADEMPFLKRFDTAPLIQPILFKTFVYWLFVFIARLLEGYVHYVIDMGKVIGFFPFLLGRFEWHRFLFVQIAILVLFLIYTTAGELNSLLGDGELFRMLFTRRSSELKLTRRQRIRTLVAVSRLTERHSRDELRDPHSDAHRQFIALIAALTRDQKEESPRQGKEEAAD